MKNNTQPALKERIEKALEDFTKGRASMHIPPLDTDVDVVLAECSDRLSELEARCAALKNALEWLYEAVSMPDSGPIPDKYYSAVTNAASVMYETPDTDAFLAEVRAQGVDSAINTCISMMNHQHPVTSKAIDILRAHAYQIRKGAQP